MKKMILAGIAVLLSTTIGLVSLEEQVDTEPFFDSQFDGIWSGFLRTDEDFAFGNIPFVININAGQNDGIGYAMLLENPDESVEGFTVYALADVSVKKNRITFTFTDDAVPAAGKSLSFTLDYKSATDALTGKFKSTGGWYAAGNAELLRINTDSAVSGLWTDNAPGSIPIVIQLVEDNGLTGEGLIDQTYGNVTDGSVSGKNVSGAVDDGNFPYSFSTKLNAKRMTMKGSVTSDAAQKTRIKLVKAGSLGKPVKFKSLSPDVVDISVNSLPTATTSAELVIKGKSFAPGSLVFVNNGSVEVTSVSYVSKSELKAIVAVNKAIADGTAVSVLVLSPDGQTASKTNAFSVLNSGGGGGGGTTVSFAADIQPIFNNNCIFCHGGSGGLNLASGSSYNNLVNVTSNGNSSFLRVSPGDADNSYLYMKVSGDSRAGSRMPIGGSPLSAGDQEKIRTWINEGANNN